MASETFFDVGTKVKFSIAGLEGEDYRKEMMALRGYVTAIDDSPRECCYYGVKWEATDEKLADIGVAQNAFYQSDHLAKARPAKLKKPTLKVSWSKKEKRPSVLFTISTRWALSSYSFASHYDNVLQNSS